MVPSSSDRNQQIVIEVDLLVNLSWVESIINGFQEKNKIKSPRQAQFLRFHNLIKALSLKNTCNRNEVNTKTDPLKTETRN